MSSNTSSVSYFFIKKDIERLLALAQEIMVEVYLIEAMICKIAEKFSLSETEEYRVVCSGEDGKSEGSD